MPFTVHDIATPAKCRPSTHSCVARNQWKPHRCEDIAEGSKQPREQALEAPQLSEERGKQGQPSPPRQPRCTEEQTNGRIPFPEAAVGSDQRQGILLVKQSHSKRRSHQAGRSHRAALRGLSTHLCSWSYREDQASQWASQWEAFPCSCCGVFFSPQLWTQPTNVFQPEAHQGSNHHPPPFFHDDCWSESVSHLV